MKYSVEDLEFLKQKAKITYDEAMELLKKYDGDAALAIIELEKQGRLRTESQTRSNGKTGEKKQSKFWNLMRKLMAHRLVIKKGEMIIANISWLFVIIATLTAPWLVAFSFIATMVMGYKYSRTVNWDMTGEEIKSFGNKAVAGFKDMTNKVFEEERPQPQTNPADKAAQAPASAGSEPKPEMPDQKEASEIIIE